LCSEGGVGLVACSPVSNQMPPNSEVRALTIKASDVVTRRQAAPHTDLTQHNDLNVSDEVAFVAETKEHKAKTKLKTFQSLLFVALTLQHPSCIF
jgi:hypothetical protein